MVLNFSFLWFISLDFSMRWSLHLLILRKTHMLVLNLSHSKADLGIRSKNPNAHQPNIFFYLNGIQVHLLLHLSLILKTFWFRLEKVDPFVGLKPRRWVLFVMGFYQLFQIFGGLSSLFFECQYNLSFTLSDSLLHISTFLIMV